MQIGKYTLDPFQVQAVIDLRQSVRQQNMKTCLALRTGGGKTIISAALMAGAIAKGKRCLFLANRRLLVGQKSKTLMACGLQHSILMDGHDYSWSDIVVASRDTFHSRVVKAGKIPAPLADVVIVDELHDNLGGTAEGIYALYPKAVFIGLTATPCGPKGLGLGAGWRIVAGPTHQELVQAGRLVDLADPCYAPAPPDLRGVGINTVTGDYVTGRLSKVMDSMVLVGDAVKTWLQHGQGRPTVAFTVDVAHSKSVQQAFLKAGVPWGHVDATTPDTEREAMYGHLVSGRLKGISNCEILTTGWDFPGCSCAILLRPTRSVRLYLQQVGRVLRSAPGKQDALLIDHAGNIQRHGWPTVEREWPESDALPVKPLQTTPATPEVRHCPSCAAMWCRGPQCPVCGWRPATKKAAAKCVVTAELVAVSAKSVKKVSQKSDEQKAWLRILAICANTGKTIGTARSIFFKQTGKWPDAVGPSAPSGQNGVKVAVRWPNFVRRKR